MYSLTIQSSKWEYKKCTLLTTWISPSCCGVHYFFNLAHKAKFFFLLITLRLLLAFVQPLLNGLMWSTLSVDLSFLQSLFSVSLFACIRTAVSAFLFLLLVFSYFLSASKFGRILLLSVIFFIFHRHRW